MLMPWLHLAGPAALAALLAAFAAPVRADAPGRVLTFPDDRTVGRVYIRDAADDRHWIDFSEQSYDRIIDARGAVTLAANEAARLDLNEHAVAEPAFLEAIDPEPIRCIAMYQTSATDETVTHLLRFTELRYVAMGGTAVTDKGVAKLCTLPHLDGLDLFSTPITDAALAHIAKVKAVTHLRLSNTGVSAAGMAHLKDLPHLRDLDVSQCPIDDEALKAIGEIAPLESLVMRDASVSSDGLAHLSDLKHLQTLDMTGVKVDSEGLKHIASLPVLEKVQASSEGLSEDDLAALARVPTLKSLTLRGAPFTDAILAELAKLPQFEELNLSGGQVTDAGVKHLATSKSLKRLWLQNAKITNEGLAALAPLRDMEHLLLNGLDLHGDALRVVENFPKLESLSVSSRPGRNIDLTPIATLENLLYLDLWIPDMTDADLSHVATLQNLRRLNVHEARLTDAAVPHIVGLENLQSLSVFSAMMTDDALKAFGTMTSLQSLQIGGDFTDAGVAQLSRLDRLFSLFLNTAGVSAEALDELKTALPRLTHAQAHSMNPAQRISVGAPVPDITLTTLDEQAIRLADQRGKVMFIHFWATWCGPCMANMPALVALQEQMAAYGDDYFALGVNLDVTSHNADAEVRRAQRAMEQHDITWTQVFDKANTGDAVKAFGAYGVPTYVVIDTDGLVAYSGSDFSTMKTLLRSRVEMAAMRRALRGQFPDEAEALIAAYAKLVDAVTAGDTAQVQTILKNHAALDRPAWLPVAEADEANQPAIAELLLEHGAAVTIWQAARLGMADLVKAQLDADAALLDSVEHGTGPTPLGAAAHRNHVDVMKLLIDRGAQVNKPAGASTRNTPLHLAAEGAVEAVQLLLAHDADTTAVNNWGSTPLVVARWAVTTNLTTSERGQRIIELLDAHARKETP